MTQHDPKRPAPRGPLPPPPAPPPMRSTQPTLAMGDNVNAPVGSLPPPPVLPAHLAPKTTPATRVPAQYAKYASYAPKASSTVTTPRAVAPSVWVQTRHRARAAAAKVAERAKAWSSSQARELAPRLARTKAWFAQQSRAARQYLEPRLQRALPWLVEHTKRARTWLAPRWQRLWERVGRDGQRGLAWLEADRRRWSLPGASALMLLGGVAWCSFGHTGEPKPGVSPDVTRFGVALPAPSDRHAALAGTSSRAEDEAKPADALPLANRDPRFAVRKSASVDSCDDALGQAFRLEPEQSGAKAAQMWTRSRKSLMLGNTERALKEMCLSASWDAAGRGTYGLSEYYFRESDFQQSLLWAERVPESSRRYVDARAMIGDVYSQLGDVSAALEAYMKGWNMNAADAETRREVAGSFTQAADSALRKKDWWTAERFYRRALTLDEDRAEAATGLARVLLHFEFPKPAAQWAERALALDGRSSVAALALCEAHIQSRDAEGARAALNKLRTMAPNDPKVIQLAERVESL